MPRSQALRCLTLLSRTLQHGLSSMDSNAVTGHRLPTRFSMAFSTIF
jgi:hypothetical protein